LGINFYCTILQSYTLTSSAAISAQNNCQILILGVYITTYPRRYGLVIVQTSLMLRKINFYRRAFMSDNNGLHTVFMSFLMSGCDEMLKSVFTHKAAAVSLVHGRFASHVCGGA